MSTRSLRALLAIYRWQFAPRLRAHLDYYRRLPNLDQAIRFALFGRDGVPHKHQRHIGRPALQEATAVLARHADEIGASDSFDRLITGAKGWTEDVDRFDFQAVYDTSLRLGAHLDMWPDGVYLHEGNEKGAAALELGGSGDVVEIDELPDSVASLGPVEAGDLLCVCGDELAKVKRDVVDVTAHWECARS